MTYEGDYHRALRAEEERENLRLALVALLRTVERRHDLMAECGEVASHAYRLAGIMPGGEVDRALSRNPPRAATPADGPESSGEQGPSGK